jgi:2-keto-3-deoxy-L-rhamnonate aldolase RhmA
MNENAYRARAERGEVQIGTWVTMIRTPAVLTLLRAAGLDFARVDMEHSAFSIETIADMAMLARAMDFPIVVRPPEGNREWITRLLDAGVWNLHVPQVDTPAQAAEIAACCRYAPLGERGMYGFGPHTEYRTLPAREHMATANARVHVTAMLESKRAFERLDEIAAVPGIDALTLGPTDLAQDLGVLGTAKQRDALDDHRRRLVEAARKPARPSRWRSTAWRPRTRWSRWARRSSTTHRIRRSFAPGTRRRSRRFAVPVSVSVARTGAPRRVAGQLTAVEPEGTARSAYSRRFVPVAEIAGRARRMDRYHTARDRCRSPTSPSFG